VSEKAVVVPRRNGEGRGGDEQKNAVRFPRPSFRLAFVEGNEQVVRQRRN